MKPRQKNVYDFLGLVYCFVILWRVWLLSPALRDTNDKKTYQFKTYCKGDRESSKTASIIMPGIMTKQRWTPLRVQVKRYSNSTALCWLKQLVSPNLNTIFRLYTFVNHAWPQCHKRWRVISCWQLNYLLPQSRLTVVMFLLCLSVCWQNNRTQKVVDQFLVKFLEVWDVCRPDTLLVGQSTVSTHWSEMPDYWYL